MNTQATIQVTRRPTRRQRAARRGSATLEFALVLPLLLSVALLCVDFGRFAHYYIAVNNAARAGAGCGSNSPYTTQTQANWKTMVQQAARDELVGNLWFDHDPSKITVLDPVVAQEAGGLWRVQVEVHYPFRTLINWPFLPNYNQPFVLRGMSTMRLLYK